MSYKEYNFQDVDIKIPISSAGLEHGLERKQTSVTHSHLLYENSLTKISQKILTNNADDSCDIVLSLNCELVSQVGIHLQVRNRF